MNEQYNYLQEDYLKRQPRVNVRAMNYNFEQFKEYTKIYEDARVKDDKQSEKFWKLVKYVQANVDENGKPKELSNLIVRDFVRKYQVELIDIPEEFKDLRVDSDVLPEKMPQTIRKRVFTRTDKSLKDYHVWKSVDRGLLTQSP